MGEARRKREQAAAAVCICGTDLPALSCCYTGKTWHKRSAALGLHTLPRNSVVEKCYMKALRSCQGGLSREHLISESVMRVLAGDGPFTIGGTPWLPAGEHRQVGYGSLTGKCLCSKHNSALHPLDDAALSFFKALKSCLDGEASALRYLVSGHDIERWLLKTLKALAMSENLGRGTQKLSGAFPDDIRVLELLDDQHAWPAGAGLYCTMATGDQTVNHPRFQIQPYTDANEEIVGLWTRIFGLSFILMLQPLDKVTIPHQGPVVYRPRKIIAAYPGGKNQLWLSWEDGLRHDGDLTLRYVGDVPAAEVED